MPTYFAEIKGTLRITGIDEDELMPVSSRDIVTADSQEEAERILREKLDDLRPMTIESIEWEEWPEDEPLTKMIVASQEGRDDDAESHLKSFLTQMGYKPGEEEPDHEEA